MSRTRGAAILLLLLLTAFASAQEAEAVYEDYAAECAGIETVLTEGTAITPELLTRIDDLIVRLETTRFRDLYNKAELLDYLANQRYALQETERNREAIEASLSEELLRIRMSERSAGKKDSLLAPALVTGGLSLVISNLTFMFANSAYEQYITAVDPAIGGYYQRMWESFEAAGYISGIFTVLSVLGVSESLAASDKAFLPGVPDLVFQPSAEMVLMDPGERYAAVEEEISRTEADIRKAVTGLRRNTTADRVFLTSAVLAFLTSGVSGYLAGEMDRNLESDPYNSRLIRSRELYSTIAGLSAAGGTACLSGSLLLRVFRPRPRVHEQKLAELEVYKRTLE